MLRADAVIRLRRGREVKRTRPNTSSIPLRNTKCADSEVIAFSGEKKRERDKRGSVCGVSDGLFIDWWERASFRIFIVYRIVRGYVVGNSC